jgi:type II secretory pathway pseudopilin PulG
MMNRKRGRHHNIYGVRVVATESADLPLPPARDHAQAGYTLVALLAMMTVLALIALSAAPSVRQQAQREREKEAIFRGEQVADAIRDYYLSRIAATGGPGEQGLPTSMDQLLEGIPIPGGSKRRQVLRASAARDPLSKTGEWRTVRPRAQELIEFQRAVVVYAGNALPQPTNGQIAQLQQFAVPQITSVLDTGSATTAPGGEDSSADSSGPFVGVTSRSRNNSVLYYYGIDRHDQWIFTPLFK